MDFNYHTAPEMLKSGAPDLPLNVMWSSYRSQLSLLSKQNRRSFKILVIGTGLAGASASAALGELGYQVTTLCLQDSPRRAHSIAAQGGINAAYNLANDGDSVERLFRDTMRGGDFRARECNVFRLAELSTAIIDQCVAQGVPFAREYGGALATRSFGGTQVARTFYARGQTGQQLLLGAYGSMLRQVQAGTVVLKTRREMVDLIVADGRACGVICRCLLNGQLEVYLADAVLLASGGYSSIFHLSTNGLASNITAAFACYKRGALFANPCFTQIHPTCLPQSYPLQSKLVLMSESMRNDGRVWVPSQAQDPRPPEQIPEDERDYFLERMYPAYGNLVPRDIASRAVRDICLKGLGVGSTGLAVYLELHDAIERLGLATIEERYGNLFEMYEQITGIDPRLHPFEIYPAPHYTMGGLWVDYSLMTSIPGLFALGEANFSDHGANRLGASALMQGLADGYFIIPYTLANYLSKYVGQSIQSLDTLPAIQAQAQRQVQDYLQQLHELMTIHGSKSALRLGSALGNILWNRVGMVREQSSLEIARSEISCLEEEFWRDLAITGSSDAPNSSLIAATRLKANLEFSHLLVLDAWHRQESCGGHCRLEYCSANGDCQRNDQDFSYVAAWEFQGTGQTPILHKEPLEFTAVTPSRRSYR